MPGATSESALQSYLHPFFDRLAVHRSPSRQPTCQLGALKKQFQTPIHKCVCGRADGRRSSSRQRHSHI